MTSDAKRTTAFFDAAARDYEARYGGAAGLWHRHFLAGRRRFALRALLAARPARVADVGSGPGVLTKALRDAGIAVIALDRSPAMLHRAAQGGASAVAADALALPLRDGAVDAAVALGLTSYVDDLPALFRELARIVRPGGLVVVGVANARSPDWTMRRALRRPAKVAGFDGLLTSGIGLRTHDEFAWRAAARDAGLHVTHAVGHDFTVFPLSRLLPGPSIAVSRALEARGARPSLASTTLLRLTKPGSRHASADPPSARRPLHLVRIVARLNVGGPALHAVLATAGLRPDVDTTLAVGRVARGEVEAGDLLARFGVAPVRVAGLGRRLAPLDDLRAFAGLCSLIRRVRPDVVHTHTAKAGALGRLAARACGVPHVIHTFHGHVFTGYFGAFASRAAVLAERALARLADRVVAVSQEVGDDLVDRFRVVPREKLVVVPVGLPLEDHLDGDRRRGALRRELALPPQAPIAVSVGRLVPVKEPALALDAWRLVRREVADARLVVVGEGELAPSLRARRDDGVVFLGWRRDLATILADADLALLTSRNEGTPVALVEAAASGVPAVATRVGGVPSVVEDGVTGVLVPPGDPAAVAAAVVALLRDPERRTAMGVAARRRAAERFSAARLLADLRALYTGLLRRP